MKLTPGHVKTSRKHFGEIGPQVRLLHSTICIQWPFKKYVTLFLTFLLTAPYSVMCVIFYSVKSLILVVIDVVVLLQDCNFTLGCCCCCLRLKYLLSTILTAWKISLVFVLYFKDGRRLRLGCAHATQLPRKEIQKLLPKEGNRFLI